MRELPPGVSSWMRDPMGIADRILEWLLREVKLPISVIQDHMAEMDQDKDCCISVAELVIWLKDFNDHTEE